MKISSSNLSMETIFMLPPQTSSGALPQPTTKVTADNRLSASMQKQLREAALKYFYPGDTLKATRPNSVLYVSPDGNFVAHVTTAEYRNNKFWISLRSNHLSRISQAKRAEYVVCGTIGNTVVRFAFPITIDNGVTYIGNQPVKGAKVTVSGGNHQNLHLYQKKGKWFLDVGEGGVVEADDYALPRVWIHSHYRTYPVAASQATLRHQALPSTVEIYDLIVSVIQDVIDKVNQNDPNIKIVVSLQPV